METLLYVLAFIGTFSSGFFCCLALVFAATSYQHKKELRRKRKAGEKNDTKGESDKRDQHRSGNVQ